MGRLKWQIKEVDENIHITIINTGEVFTIQKSKIPDMAEKFGIIELPADIKDSSGEYNEVYCTFLLILLYQAREEFETKKRADTNIKIFDYKYYGKENRNEK